MEATPAEGLAEIVRLKRHLYQLKINGEISLAHFTQLNTELDVLSYGFVDDLSALGLPELVNDMAKRYPSVHFSVLEPTLKKQRIVHIQELRAKAIKANLPTLVVDQLFGNLKAIPLNRFSWRALIESCISVQRYLNESECTAEELVGRIEPLFGDSPDSHFFADAASLQKNIFRKLIMEGLVTADTVESFKHDEDTIRNQLNDQMSSVRGCTTYQELKKFSVGERFTFLYELAGTADIDDAWLVAIVQWTGPDLHKLLQRVWSANSHSQRLAELILARTGIHPLSQPDPWRTWLSAEQSRMHAELTELHRLINQDRLLYDIIHIISLKNLSSDSTALIVRWLPLLNAVTEKRRTQKEQQAQRRKLLESSSKPVRAISSVPVSPVAQKQEEDSEPLIEALDAGEIESLSAPQATFTQDDRLVAKHSSWNEYVKPFLSENWLGLIGIGFIMAAWPILSMMVWNLGEYYRLAAGAVPLLFITLGSAWITQFFAKLKNPDWQTQGTLLPLNKKPVQLFSCLTAWTLPFNILMAVSMFDAANYLTGCLMLLVYGGAMWLIGPWLRAALGQKSRLYLILSHLLLFLPAVSKTLSIEWLAYGLSGMVYAYYFLISKRLFSTFKENGLFGPTFNGLFYGGHALLGLAATHIFYKQFPAIGTVAILAELTALSMLILLSTRAAASATVVISAGVLSVLGLLLGLADMAFSPIIITLSAAYWFLVFKQKQIENSASGWVMEVFAAHPILLATSFYVLLDFTALLTFASAGLVVAGLWYIENSIAKRELKILSWGLPLALAIASVILSGTHWVDIACFVLILVAALFNYRRACHLYDVGLWYAGILLLICLPPAFFNSVLVADSIHLTSYLSVISLAWVIGAKYGKTGLVQTHATALAWLVIGVTGSLALLSCLAIGMTWRIELVLSLVAVAVSSAIVAKRSQSALPTYFSVMMIVALCLAMKQYFDLHSSTGLGSAILALLFLYLAPLLQLSPLFRAQENSDRFFNKPFFFTSELYLQAPIEQCAWLILTLSIFKSAVNFSPAWAHITLLLAYLLQGVGVLYLANRYRLSWVAGLSLIPISLGLGSVILSFNNSVQPVASILLWIGVFYLNRWIQSREILNAVVNKPMALTHVCLAYTFIPAAFLGYGVAIYVNSSPIWVTLFSCLCLYYIQVSFISLKRFRFAHLSIAHVVVLWTIAFALLNQSHMNTSTGWQAACELGLQFSFGLFTLLFLIAYGMEWKISETLRAYRESAQRWMFALSLVPIPIYIFALMTSTEDARWTVGISYMTASLIGLHLANRYFHQISHYLLKWLVSWMLMYALLGDITLSAIASAYLYLVLEWVWHLTTKIPAIQLQGAGDHWQTPKTKIASILFIAVAAAVAVHQMGMAQTLESSMNPAWLFAMLPLSFLLYRLLNWEVLAFSPAGLFIYANVFVALQWRGLANDNGLTSLHLISGALIFSIACLIVILRILPQRMVNKRVVESANLMTEEVL